MKLPERGLDLKAYLSQIEEHFYRSAIDRADGNGEQAARHLGLSGAAFRDALRGRFEIEDSAV